MAIGDRTPLTGQICAFRDLPDGLVRGSKYDVTSAKELSKLIEGVEEDNLRRALTALGAEFRKGSADISVTLPYLPRFPIYMNIWLADDEFPPSAKMLVDAAGGRYLTIEDAVCVGDVIITLLKDELLKGLNN